MPPTIDKNLVISLDKVLWMKTLWVSQNGIVRQKKPNKPTAYNQPLTKELGYFKNAAGEWLIAPMNEIAIARNLVDVWLQLTVVKMGDGQTLTASGDKAKSLWDAWKAKQFGKAKSKTKL